MKRYWHPDPSQRPTIKEIFKLSDIFYDTCYYDVDYNKNFCPGVYDTRLKFNEAGKNDSIELFSNNLLSNDNFDIKVFKRIKMAANLMIMAQ
ncbi:hypothetical protein Glove_346g126 [Diversispora epigaea]|uniref:Uncharacterized protein n=1 Tax=Diversispora epigaea TaxID=1348612 RepID=A0A397HJI3_9GLOM|nr:hypothetical protein Glove_346g126 [Diversispora epigaea]